MACLSRLFRHQQQQPRPLHRGRSLVLSAAAAVMPAVLMVLLLLLPGMTVAGGSILQEEPTAKEQLQAMQKVKAALGATNVRLATWMSTNPCDGSWYGVSCARPNVITHVNLAGVGVGGTLSPFIGNLTGLLQLLLNNNSIGGAIPPTLGNLYAAQDVQLQGNRFSGAIPPELGGMVTCARLYLDGNRLSGSVPASLGVIADLRVEGNSLCSMHPGQQCSTFASAPPPAPPCKPCAAGKVLGISSCDCVVPFKLTVRFPSLDFAKFTPDMEKRAVQVLASALSLLPEQLRVAAKRKGSVILDLLLLSAAGSQLTQAKFDVIAHAIRNGAITLPPPFDKFQLLAPLPPTSKPGAPTATSSPPSPPTSPDASSPSEEQQQPDSSSSSDNGSSSSTSGGSSGGLSAGAIAGIVIGCVVALLLLACLAVVLLRRRKERKASQIADVENMRVAKTLSASHDRGSRPSFWSRWDKLNTHDPAAANAAAKVPRTNTAERSHSKGEPPLSAPNGGPSRSSSAAHTGITFGAGVAARQATSTANHDGSGAPLSPMSTSNNNDASKLSPSISDRSFAFHATASAGRVGGDSVDNLTLPTPSASPAGLAARRQGGDEEEGKASGGVSKIALKSIQIATQGFSKSSLLGDGGYGRMYKADFSSKDVVDTAVLVALAGEKLDEPEFVAQVDHISRMARLSERLVQVKGYCTDRDQRWVAYEYLPNGTLRDHLHGELRFERALTWPRRVQVALDVAEGLAFLHEAAYPNIVHKDMSAANIALDADYRAKIKNAGIHLMIRDWNEGRAVSPSVLGSLGYQAPEFRISGEQTAASDVFSFGVVLLELLTGRKPLDTSRPKGQQSLLTWVLPHLENEAAMMSLVDPYLRLNSHLASAPLAIFARIAAQCLSQEPADRPRMSAVREALDELLNHPGTIAAAMPSSPQVNVSIQLHHMRASEMSDSESNSMVDSVCTGNTFGSHIQRFDNLRWSARSSANNADTEDGEVSQR